MSRDRDRARKAALAPISRARGATVWTPARLAAVCARHATGEFLKHACAAEGGSHEGLRDAAARDPSIRAAVDKAHAEAVALLRGRKDSAMPGDDDWKKYAWDLERFDREAFGPPTQKLDVKTEAVSDETLEQVIAVVSAARKVT